MDYPKLPLILESRIDSVGFHPSEDPCNSGFVHQEQHQLPPPPLKAPVSAPPSTTPFLEEEEDHRDLIWHKGKKGDPKRFQESASIPAPKSPGTFKCAWKGCEHQGGFNRKTDLKRHVEISHIFPSKFQCPAELCRKTFNRKDNLESHMRLHLELNEPLRVKDGRFFESNWDLPFIVAGISDKMTFLLDTITLTRSDDKIEASTCGQYIREAYGHSGIRLLLKLISVIEQDDETEDDYIESADFMVKMQTNKIFVSFSPSFNHLWDLLLWICLTFRQPHAGEICLSTCKIDGNVVTLQELTPSAIPEHTSCWSGLFDTAIVVMDPRIKCSSQAFLDIDFNMMLQIAAVEYPVMVDNGLILMGYSTALVPVEDYDHRTILWHLETAKHDFQFKTTEILATEKTWLKKTKLEDLQVKRALLGWCPQAISLLGTSNSGSSVRLSDARVKYSTWSWRGANLQFTATTTSPLQIGGQIGVEFKRTLNTLRFSAGKNYQKCLTNSVKEQVVVYDVIESRAWLVPLICVFHEMLLAYWQKIPTAHQKGPIPLAVPSADGALASLDALSDSGGCIVEGTGEDQLTIRDLVLGFSVNMSKTAICPPWRSKIYGYEFMDIVMDSPQGHLKENRTDKEGLAWISLLRQVNCFFCSGLGDAIIGLKANARESPCNKLPRGFDWLATTMHSLDTLNNRHCSQSTSIERRVSDQLSWFMTGSPFQMCQHAIGSQVSCWNTSPFLQEIKDHNQKPQQRHGHWQPQEFCDGAVVFGRGRRAVNPIPMDSCVGMVFPAQSTQESTAVLTFRTAQESSMDGRAVELAASEHFVQS